MARLPTSTLAAPHNDGVEFTGPSARSVFELGHRVNNPSSCTVATRAGFAAEGVERFKLHYGGERFDVDFHARLCTDRLCTDPAPDIPMFGTT